MCGIVGLIGEPNGDRANESIKLMLTTLERRGPDDEGADNWRHAALGHRRLSIFDLSKAGRQPMLSADCTIGVVFNGAIYNFRELRRELVDAGYGFATETDTEVLLHGYSEWGIDGLVRRIRGMFAFGLWDDNQRKLFLVRDRLGVKPLVFAFRNKQLAFASTVRAIDAAGFAGDIDEQAVADFLEFGFVTEKRTIYQGVAKVPAASILEWSGGTIQLRQYWQPPQPGREKIGFDDAVEETERLLLKAVEKRLFADVPVGSLLSGGIDSSLVCWALAKLGADITAYTVGTPNSSADETADARKTAAFLGIRHKTIDISESDGPRISELGQAYCEPFACASALGMLRVSRALSSEATVLLTGDGGDDVFLGYPEHRHLWLAQRLARTLPGRATDFWRQLPSDFFNQGGYRRLVSLLNYSSGGLGAVTSAHDGLPAFRQRGVLGPRLLDHTVDERKIEWSQTSARNVLSDYLDYDRQTRFVSEFLTKVDGATMYFGLEARSPFLDQDLWEFAAALPFSVRLHRGKQKAILREIARRRLGERVARARKRGFTIPVEEWLAGKWQNAIESTLRDSILAREGWIVAEAALSWLKDSIRIGKAPKQLWYLFVLESWLRLKRESDSKRKVGACIQESCATVE